MSLLLRLNGNADAGSVDNLVAEDHNPAIKINVNESCR